MSLAPAIYEIEYPESDGKPMGETDIHRDWMVRILEILRWRYRDQRMYVASDLFLYYAEGDPTQSIVPDVFLVKDCDPSPRRTFKVWEENEQTPNVVFEVTSRGSRREDHVFKPKIYARLGVKEYFLYDPTAEYLRPPLMGFRLDREGYVPIEPDATGALTCVELGLLLRLERGRLAMFDAVSGERQSTEAEAERLARAEAEAGRRQAEAGRRQAEADRHQAEARAAELEAEIQRLRQALERNAPPH